MVSAYGADLLAQVLGEEDIEHMVLADNQIDDMGAALARALKDNDTLKSLFLQGNPIGERGVMAFLDNMEEFNGLQTLDRGVFGRFRCHCKNPIG